MLLAAAFFVPSLSSDLGFQSAAIYIVLGAIGATGLGLILGLAGQLSLGHAVFYIIGGYGVAILTVKSGWGLLPATVVAVAGSMVVAYVIGRLTVRLSGFNLALATLAIQLIALVVVAQQYPQGITGLPIMHLFGTEFIDAKQFFYLGMGILCVCLLIARNIWVSQTGLALRAVGRDQEAAESLGLDVSKLKLRILVLGATMASLAGRALGGLRQLRHPDQLGRHLHDHPADLRDRRRRGLAVRRRRGRRGGRRHAVRGRRNRSVPPPAPRPSSTRSSSAASS